MLSILFRSINHFTILQIYLKLYFWYGIQCPILTYIISWHLLQNKAKTIKQYYKKKINSFHNEQVLVNRKEEKLTSNRNKPPT